MDRIVFKIKIKISILYKRTIVHSMPLPPIYKNMMIAF